VAERKEIEIDFGRVEAERVRLNIGPQHPSTHGVLRLEVELDGEIVTEVVPHIGYLHRCFEKYCEQSTFTQVVPYIDRLDYISPMSNEIPYALGVEKMMDIKVSDRVQIIRTILAELNRIASHQIAVATFGMDAGAFTPFLYLFRDRELILDVFERLSGGRLLYNYIRVGGLMKDIYPTFKDDVRHIINTVRVTNEEVTRLLIDNKIFIERTINIGVMPGDYAVNHGCSGPTLRGSGVTYDLRRDAPYLLYDKLDFDVCVGKGIPGTLGDCYDRNIVRVWEMEESCKMLEQLCTMLPDASEDVRAAIPKKIAPKGEIYVKAENPKGELGFYIVGDGKNKPYRIKGRSPSFVNLSALPGISKGCMIADLIIILGSIDIVLGEIDR
jgi:NADH-quinone oxidoreductase subunit D